MHAAVDNSEDVAIVQLAGRLTFSENGAFRQMMNGLDRADRGHVVIDLAGVEFIDSAGMGLLLVARDLVTGRGGKLRLRHAGGQVGRMLELARFGDIFAIDAYAQV